MERENIFIERLLSSEGKVTQNNNFSVLKEKAVLQKEFDNCITEALRNEISLMGDETNVRFTNQDHINVIPEDQINSVLNQKDKDIKSVFGENSFFQSLIKSQE